jgi:hypothetical protein
LSAKTKEKVSMRIIITGGTGFIGRPLATSLTQDGHEVIVLSRTPDRATNLPAGLRVVGWDGRSAAGWGQYADGAGAIVNLAGERVAGASPGLRWTEERKRRICESREQAGAAVVEAVARAQAKPGVVVQMSGIDYYATGDAIATEESPSGSGFLSHVVRDCWEASTADLDGMGVRRVVVRTAPVLGADSPILGPILLQHKLMAGGTLGSGKQWFPWVHLLDVISAIRFLIDTPAAQGPFNLVAPEMVTNADLSKTVGRVLGRPSWLPAPAFAFKLAFGEMSVTLLEGVRAQPKRLLDLGYRYQFPTLEAAVRESIAQ